MQEDTTIFHRWSKSFHGSGADDGAKGEMSWDENVAGKDLGSWEFD